MGQRGFLMPISAWKPYQRGAIRSKASIVWYRGAEIEVVVLTPDELKKSSAGRKPFDAMLMFRMLVLQALNGLSSARPGCSFSRLGSRSRTAFRTPRRCGCSREKLAKAGLIEKLFERFDQHLAAKGYIALGGQEHRCQYRAGADAAEQS